MKILGLEIKFSSKKEEQKVESFNPARTGGNWGHGYTVSFDGEKNVGEIGPILNYKLNYKALAARSWQSFLESEISRTVLSRFSVWVVDKGLKLQCAPSKPILEANNIQLDTEKFNENVEALFSIWAKSKQSSYSEETTFNEISKEVFKHAKVGGDVLVVLRYEKGKVTVDLIDTHHLSDFSISIQSDNKNKIVHGVEMDARGRHVAYHIDCEGKTETIKAYNSQGLRVAFLVYGSKYRADNNRGLPVIATSLETMKKIERYKEAAVGSAEERSKIPYTVEHNQFSDGENPMASQLGSLFDANNDDSGAVPITAEGERVANTVAASTNKMVFNMPVGSQLKSLESKNEMFFKEFYGTNADIICAAVGIPPNVAFSIYNDSFSASRAATKDWEHTIDVERDSFQTQFHDRVFAFWFHVQILEQNIQAPGYLVAFKTNNYNLVNAYLNARFTGPMFPHIDPLKEVKAEREKLGPNGAHIPLTTVERATETLAGGDSASNMEQFSEEYKRAEQLGIFSSQLSNLIDDEE